MRDLYNNITTSQVLAPVVATTTQTSAAVDTKGYDSVAVLCAIGQSADTLSGTVYWTLKLQESDDNSVYVDVAIADLHNAAATVVIDAAAEDELVVKFGYKGSKRYLKAVATATGTHTNGTPMGMVALLANPALAPVA